MGWALDLFAAHFRAVAGENTLHPEDVFLAGAAGYRYTAAWSAIDSEHRDPCLRVLSKMKVEAAEPEDLWSEAMVRLAAASERLAVLEGERVRLNGAAPAKMAEYSGRAGLRNYILLVAKRHALGIARRRPMGALVEEPGGGAATAPDRAERERMLLRLTDALEGCSATERSLLTLVHICGIAQKTAGEMLGLPGPYAVTRMLQGIGKRLAATLAPDGSPPPDRDPLLWALSFLPRVLQMADSGASSSSGGRARRSS